MANPLEIGQNYDPNDANKPTWEHIWNDAAWHSQENNWLTPSGEVQFAEWSQQMIATQYQNWYNSAPEQMKRAIEAGINPFVAASGIAGSDTGQVASPPPQSQPMQHGIPAAVSQLGQLAGGLSNVAGGVGSFAKLSHEISKIDAETVNTLEQMGFTKLQSKAMSIQLKFMGKRELIGVWQALANFEKTSQEYQNLNAQHRNILKQYDEIIQNIELMRAQEGDFLALEKLHKAQADKEAELAKWAKIEREFFEVNGYKLGTPIYESLRDRMVSMTGTFDFEAFGDTVSGYEGKISTAVEEAKAEATWLSRPTTPAAVGAQIAHDGAGILKSAIDKFTSGKKLDQNDIEALKKDKRFQNAYDDYLDWLDSKVAQSKAIYKSRIREPYYTYDQNKVDKAKAELTHWTKLRENMSFAQWLEKSSFETEYNP